MDSVCSKPSGNVNFAARAAGQRKGSNVVTRPRAVIAQLLKLRSTFELIGPIAVCGRRPAISFWAFCRIPQWVRLSKWLGRNTPAQVLREAPQVTIGVLYKELTLTLF